MHKQLPDNRLTETFSEYLKLVFYTSGAIHQTFQQMHLEI